MDQSTTFAPRPRLAPAPAPLANVDVLSEILRSLQLRGSMFFRSRLQGPWGFESPPAGEPHFHIVLAGRAWFHADPLKEPLALTAGSAVLLRESHAHWIADSPRSPRVSAAEVGAAYKRGAPLFQGPRPDCHMLCGLFRFNRELQHPLMETLPPVSVIRGDGAAGLGWVNNLGALMDSEMAETRAGSGAMVDRLSELFLIQMLRHLADHVGQPAGFVAALDDTVINRALGLIHQHPGERWDLETLARSSGLSRSAFASRFHNLVGIPPKAYLTMWRMQKARSLMRNPHKLLGQIASEVGYSSDVALIRAFQRHFAMSPKEMRRRLAADQPD